jgi:hypothetical protein
VLASYAFMISGLIGVGVSTVVGYALSRLYF